MAADLLNLLARAATSTEALLARLTPADHPRPTPCPEMTVAEVTAHLIGGMAGFATVGEGGALSFGADADPDIDAAPAQVTYRAAVDRLLAAFGQPGRLDATYTMPWGETTGGQLVGFELIETVVHGWDIARGIGAELHVEDDVASETLAGARQWVDESVRVPGMFGPEVHVGAVAPLDALVAFLGRDPAWPA